ncbi:MULTISPECIES: ATP-binding protein [unclassified Streptomyces]|uniref:ATP-binding protein n=1 Tax=unclassified Streptomyces TaxID=2593676 RepID=UPI0022531662|nr:MULTISPECIES: ATP-binding protein [unclassified Streptomyces]MCX4526772.1 ATP-binding protein [Streptomyces sp. NBC_01551]MCX4542667.1 ATP-binding protein [Streptomyces sp. NBC_01565]
MSIWWSLHLRREAASVPLARRLLLGTMETAGVDPDISFDLSVALSEACANAVEHGGPAAGAGSGPDGDPVSEACAAYRVTAYLDGDCCRIEVTDSGPGFPPSTVSGYRPGPAGPSEKEHGRGLGLITELADHALFRNRPGRGAVVSFDKILKWREGALLKVS